jgi:O-antigen/teichoic acid export membrane protein
MNAVFKVASSAANFLLVPIYLKVYGLQAYGSLSLLLSLGQYLSFLDLGFSAALVRESLRLRSSGTRSYFRFRRAIVGIIVIAGGTITVLGAVTARYWGPTLRMANVGDLGLGVCGAGLITIFGLVAGALNSAFVSTLRFGYANIATIFVNLVPQLVCLGTYVNGQALGASLLAGGWGAGLVVVAQVVVLRREEQRMTLSPVTSNSEALGPFLRASIGFSAQTITSGLIIPLLQTVVGAKFGPQANGLLDASRRLLFAGRQAVEALFVPVFARTTELLERGETGEIRRLAKRASLGSAIVALAFFLSFAALLPSIVEVWLGTDRGEPVLEVARLLLLGVTFTCPHIAIYQILSAFPDGRMTNVVAGSLSLLVLLTAFFSPVRTLPQVTALYAVATLIGSVVTFVLAFRILPRLLETQAAAC